MTLTMIPSPLVEPHVSNCRPVETRTLNPETVEPSKHRCRAPSSVHQWLLSEWRWSFCVFRSPVSLGPCSVGAFTSTRHYALAYLGAGGGISLVVVIVFRWHLHGATRSHSHHDVCVTPCHWRWRTASVVILVPCSMLLYIRLSRSPFCDLLCRRPRNPLL